MKKKWESLSENKKNTLIIILCFAVLLSFLIYRLYSNYRKRIESEAVSKEVLVVRDESRYFTVISCIQKYLNYVQSRDKSSILEILSEEYKSNNGINENNVLDFIPKLDANLLYDYSGDIMYSHKISKNVSEYYVHGFIKSEGDGISEYSDYNVTVILYENKLVFSIKPGVEV